MNKKILISLLALILALVMVVPALAETYTTTTTETTELPDGTTVTVTTTTTITITKPGESEDEPAASLGSGLPGGWTVNPDATEGVLPEEVKAAFDAATSKLLGVEYVPVAYLGSQVVAGTNYAVLAKKTAVAPDAETTLAVLIINADLNGDASVLHINDFSFDAPEAEDAADQLGGWTVPEEYTVVNLPADVASAFTRANEALLGNNLEPIAFLASQTVSGMNYAVLCRSTLTTADPVSSIQLAIVYEDLDGNASFRDIFTVDPAAYNFDAEEPAADAESEEPAAEGEPEPEPVPVLGAGLVGGWDVSGAAPETVLPDEVKAAFDAATAKLLGVDYVPVAYLGSQVVAGKNYAVLCKKTAVAPDAETTLAVLIIYQDLEGDASVLYINDFDVTAASSAETPAAQLAGGWTVPEEYEAYDLPEGAAQAFAKANEAFLGNRLEPVAYLGSQLVSGTNYAILCRSTLATNPPVSSIQVAIVYEDLDGSAVFSDIHTVNIADYNQAPEMEAEEPAFDAEPVEALPEAEEPALDAEPVEESAFDSEGPENNLGTGLLGGWDFSSDTYATLPEEVQEAFDTAVVTHKLLGVDYVPVAYLGSQVVSGTNYAILARKTAITSAPESTLVVLIIYQDLTGDATILHVNDFVLDGEEAEEAGQAGLLGGWTLPENTESAALPEDAAAAFAKANEGFVGNNLVPIAYLGRQIVNGTNYAILCRSTLVTADPISSIQVVIVSEDAEGAATFSSIRTVSIEDYNLDIEP